MGNRFWAQEIGGVRAAWLEKVVEYGCTFVVLPATVSQIRDAYMFHRMPSQLSMNCAIRPEKKPRFTS